MARFRQAPIGMVQQLGTPMDVLDVVDRATGQRNALPKRMWMGIHRETSPPPKKKPPFKKGRRAAYDLEDNTGEDEGAEGAGGEEEEPNDMLDE